MNDKTNDLLKYVILQKHNNKGDGKFITITNIGSSYFTHYSINDNKLHGLVKCYTADSSLISVTSYIDNHRNGLYTKYHTNGKIAVIGSYKDDKSWGVWKYFDKQGELIKLSFFSNV